MRAHLPLIIAVAASLNSLAVGPAAANQDSNAAFKVALGLKAPADDFVWNSEDDAEGLKLRAATGLYGGTRGVTRPGLRAIESYSGVYQPLSDRWGSSLEFGISRDSPLSAPRYTVGGQLHTMLQAGHGLSLGLKFTGAERTPGMSFAGRLDPIGVGETLPGERLFNSSTYELNVNYLYGARYSVGVAYQHSTAGYVYLPHGLTTSARSFALSGHHWLTPNWSMSYDIYAADPATLLQSPGFGLGLRYRF